MQSIAALAFSWAWTQALVHSWQLAWRLRFGTMYHFGRRHYVYVTFGEGGLWQEATLVEHVFDVWSGHNLLIIGGLALRQQYIESMI